MTCPCKHDDAILCACIAYNLTMAEGEEYPCTCDCHKVRVCPMMDIYPNMHRKDRRHFRRHLLKKGVQIGALYNLRRYLRAYVRHNYTHYEGLLKAGCPRVNARNMVNSYIDKIIRYWRGEDENV